MQRVRCQISQVNPTKVVFRLMFPCIDGVVCSVLHITGSLNKPAQQLSFSNLPPKVDLLKRCSKSSLEITSSFLFQGCFVLVLYFCSIAEECILTRNRPRLKHFFQVLNNSGGAPIQICFGCKSDPKLEKKLFSCSSSNTDKNLKIFLETMNIKPR